MIVAIDGPAGSGKSTTARLLAERLGFLYLDTGAMYRAVGLAFSRRSVEPTPPAVAEVLPTVRIDVRYVGGTMRVLLDDDDVSEAVRSPEASAMASRVATFPAVRERMVEEQRRVARQHVAQGGGVVIEGRDIGTVVFPDADVKVFMQADAAVRARRRHDEMRAKGVDADLDVVLREIRERDRQDQERDHSPLRQADDALVVDTTGLDIEAQVALIFNMVKERASPGTV